MKTEAIAQFPYHNNMRLHIYIVLLIFLFFTGMSSSFATARQKHDKFIIILDGSAKMNTTWRDDLNKYDAASLLISRLMDSMHTANEDVQFCLRLYGHLYPATMQSCKDSRLEVYFSKDNRSQTRMRLGSMQPQGSASLGYALQQSANYDIEDRFDTYNIILITSGARYCDSNVCVSAVALLNKISGKSYVLNLGYDEPIATGYSCAGNVYNISTKLAMEAIIDTICNPFRKKHTKTDTVYAYSEPLKKADTTTSTPTISIPDTIALQTGSYLLFTSNYKTGSIQLSILTANGYKPTGKSFAIPMTKKETMPSGRYRVYYTITDNDNKPQKRIKEFYIRKDLDNVVDLD